MKMKFKVIGMTSAIDPHDEVQLAPLPIAAIRLGLFHRGIRVFFSGPLSANVPQNDLLPNL